MDPKGLGYLVSVVSVLLLGAVAWPKPDEAQWKIIVLVVGMAASGIGMFIRFLTHLHEKREIDEANRTGPAAAEESA